MSRKTIGVVDYDRGNLRSVSKALETAGARVEFVTAPDGLDRVDAVVVPGVGSFGDCASNLQSTGLWEPLRAWIGAGRPYLGICLGYQLLLESSEETPGVAGLGVLKGRVVRFPKGALKVPQIGWNPLLATRGPLYEGIPDGTSMYFVHSFYPVPDDPEIVSARCEYGVDFAAGISSDALHATQFHPEKSQAAGLAVLRNFQKTL